jgi:hypothetical protein
MWDLWCTKRYWDRLFNYFGFLISILFHRRSITHLHLKVALARWTKRRTLETFQKSFGNRAALDRKNVSLQVSSPKRSDQLWGGGDTASYWTSTGVISPGVRGTGRHANQSSPLMPNVNELSFYPYSSIRLHGMHPRIHSCSWDCLRICCVPAYVFMRLCVCVFSCAADLKCVSFCSPPLSPTVV